MSDPDLLAELSVTFGARVRAALAEDFRRQLATVSGGAVYAAAVSHAQGLAWWFSVNTEEAYAGSGAPAEPADDARYLRWFPDEWTGPTPQPLPAVDELLDDLAGWLDGDENVAEDRWCQGRDAVVELLVRALGSAEVRAVFADAGARPVLVVYEPDGSTEAALASLEQLNADHPDPTLVAEARTFWRDDA